MYTFNTQLGIGKVNSIENGMVVIYFEDADKTKNVPVDFVSIYSTEEEAEEASNEKMTIEEVEAMLLAEKNRHIDRMNNQEAIRLINLETSMNCAKSL
jgi:hypothetical protein